MGTTLKDLPADVISIICPYLSTAPQRFRKSTNQFKPWSTNGQQ